MIDAHPALKAASPQAPVIDWFVGDDWHHNGALFLPHCFNFMADLRPAAAGADQEVQRRLRPRHARRLRLLPASSGRSPTPTRKYFKGDVAVLERGDEARHLRRLLEGAQPPAAPKNIKPAVMTVGGWFDAENLFGALETYKTHRGNEPQADATCW